MFPLIIFAETRCTSVQTDASKTIPLKDALSIVETEVRETYPVALSDIGTASDDKIRSALLQAQCFDNSPNPFVPVITGAISIGIQGSLQQQGGATVGGIIAAPAASLSYQVTEGKQQSLTIPVTFVSLAGLPNFFMGQNLANLSNLGATDSTRKRLTADIIARAQNLTKLVKVAITKYYANLDKCGKPGAPTLLPMVPLDLKLPKEQEVKLPDDIPSIPQNNKPPSLKLPQ
jgi:hypothetical protein